MPGYADCSKGILGLHGQDLWMLMIEDVGFGGLTLVAARARVETQDLGCRPEAEGLRPVM